MKQKILYILPNYNIYGGTPKKTLDLMKYFGSSSVLYVYENSHTEFKPMFENTSAKVYNGFYGRNLFRHLSHLLKIIDKEKINIVQTQFTMGEVLGLFIKLFRPNVKIVVAFVGSLKTSSIKSILAKRIYDKADYFIYVSRYVKTEKENQFPNLKNKKSIIIYNGTEKRLETIDQAIDFKKTSLLAIASLIKLKNIQILIEALNIIVNQYQKKEYYLYVAGDGPYRSELEKMIDDYKLQNYIFLIGNQKNVGDLLNSCDIFVHPSYAEGFGIVVTEAMLAKKPIIVSNAGALPEIIEQEKTGLIVEPHNAEDWANAIIELTENFDFAHHLANNAEESALKNFSYNKFCEEYEKLYNKLLLKI